MASGDDDIDALLDSALEEFDAGKEMERKRREEELQASQAAASSSPVNPLEALLSEGDAEMDGDVKSALELLSKVLSAADGASPAETVDLMGQLTQMAESLGLTEELEQEDVKQTMELLSKVLTSTETGSDEPSPDEQKLEQLLANLGADQLFKGATDESDEHQLQDTLSDLGTSTFRTLREVFPAWLEKSRESLSEEDYARFHRQYEVIVDVCDLYERLQRSSQEDDKPEDQQSTAVDPSAVTSKIISCMEEMHKLGKLPSELLSNLHKH
eukprot:TRINITY_DN94407_c0_g1_i1.p1 TRINITY_DN94407_c0_g1~~TRINITY_DN94407_c0_g1_i1.p1  ORF type:complete len:278 (-),score=63.41 TRINITY_DN94407_c0_g1_i1:9-821(-)